MNAAAIAFATSQHATEDASVVAWVDRDGMVQIQDADQVPDELTDFLDQREPGAEVLLLLSGVDPEWVERKATTDRGAIWFTPETVVTQRKSQRVSVAPGDRGQAALGFVRVLTTRGPAGRAARSSPGWPTRNRLGGQLPQPGRVRSAVRMVLETTSRMLQPVYVYRVRPGSTSATARNSTPGP